MKRLSSIFSTSLIVIASYTATAQSPIAINSKGWTINANPERGVLTVSQGNLGVVLQDVRLHLQGEHELQPLFNWSTEKSSQSSLTIRAVRPVGAWTFEIGPDYLKVSSTFTNAVITAEAPAPSNRRAALLGAAAYAEARATELSGLSLRASSGNSRAR